MPITIVTTIGSASANSYVSLVEADVIAGQQFPRPQAWQTAGNDEKNRALLKARQDLDQERFVGGLADGTQALVWPRAGVYKPYSPGWYLTTEIPDLIKRAQAVRAIYLVEQAAANGGSFLPDDLTGVSSFSLGSEVSVTLDTSVTGQSDRDRHFATVIRPMLGSLVYAPQPRLVRG